MKSLSGGVMCGAVFAVSAAMLAGQAPAQSHAPDFRAAQRIAPLYFPPTPGAPFSAIAHTTWVKILPDDSKVTTENARVVARDGEGRIYEERRTFVPVPNSKDQPSTVYATEYDDPVAKVVYRCRPDEKVCDEFELAVHTDIEMPAGLQKDGTTFLTRENQGEDTFSGVDVKRTRETYTFYRASIGNTNTILRTVDYWFSPSLGVNVQVKRTDPRDGDQTLWLDQLILSSPEEKWFKVPAGFRIIDHRGAAPNPGIQGRAAPPRPPGN